MGFIKNFLKKYAALLPSIGLLTAALLLLLPTLWLGGKVKAQMAASVKQAQSIRSQAANVPSKETPVQMKLYMDRLESEVNQIDALIRQSSQRELVAWNIFPEPTDDSSQVYVEYGKNYQAVVESMLKGMNALDAPSEAEIRSQTGAARPTAGGAAWGGGVRRPASQDPMVDALCMKRAELISVYASPSAFTWYDFWQKYKFEGKDPALKDCWNSQIAMWVYDDVVKTVQAMNVGSSKVSTSPVKRLLGVSFNGPVQVASGRASDFYRMEMGMGMGTTAGRDNPNYVSELLPSVFMGRPWTGRLSDADYDVVHFAVSVIIDNRHVLAFMRELCSEKEHTFREDFKADGARIPSRHNQITILQNSIAVVDKSSPVHELYRYGHGAIMQVDLVCEYLLNRKGYDSLKPKPIKLILGQQDEQTGTPGMPGMNMPGTY
jgi:hypothetical protein